MKLARNPGFSSESWVTGIEPGAAATEPLHPQVAAGQIGAVHVGDLQLARGPTV